MALRNAFEAIATEVTLQDVQRGTPDQDRRFEWQLVAGENKPLYIGVAVPGALTVAPVWAIEKYTFLAGPSGSFVPSLVQTRVGAWDSRAGLFA